MQMRIQKTTKLSSSGMGALQNYTHPSWEQAQHFSLLTTGAVTQNTALALRATLWSTDQTPIFLYHFIDKENKCLKGKGTCPRSNLAKDSPGFKTNHYNVLLQASAVLLVTYCVTVYMAERLLIPRKAKDHLDLRCCRTLSTTCLGRSGVTDRGPSTKAWGQWKEAEKEKELLRLPAAHKDGSLLQRSPGNCCWVDGI
jgi:hypothetical protein